MTAASKPNPIAPPVCYIRFPVAVLIDTREQLSYTFAGFHADKKEGGHPLLVETRRVTLKEGDYSLDGYAGRIAVERKSLADFFNTLGQGRERFEAELARLSRLQFAAVVVEAEWSTILYEPPQHSQLNPKTVSRSVIAWQQRHPTVHWWMVPDRRHGEAWTFRILKRFWDEDQGK